MYKLVIKKYIYRWNPQIDGPDFCLIIPQIKQTPKKCLL